MRSDPTAQPRAKKSFSERLREEREWREKQSEGWGGILALVMFTGFLVGMTWIVFYGPGLGKNTFLQRNWPPDPAMGEYYRYAGWGFLGLGVMTFLGTIWRGGRDGMSLGQFLKSIWVGSFISLAGLFWFALAHQYDRWFAVHGEMTREEIYAAPPWTEPGLPSLDELF